MTFEEHLKKARQKYIESYKKEKSAREQGLHVVANEHRTTKEIYTHQSLRLREVINERKNVKG